MLLISYFGSRRRSSPSSDIWNLCVGKSHSITLRRMTSYLLVHLKRIRLFFVNQGSGVTKGFQEREKDRERGQREIERGREREGEREREREGDRERERWPLNGKTLFQKLKIKQFRFNSFDFRFHSEFRIWNFFFWSAQWRNDLFKIHSMAVSHGALRKWRWTTGSVQQSNKFGMFPCICWNIFASL